MLVLSRKVGESIVIGNNIEVRVTAIAGNRVRIGIQAPDDVSILRGELCFEGIPDVGCETVLADETALAGQTSETCFA